MNEFTFSRCKATELRSLQILEPFLMKRADGRLIFNDKGPVARVLQEQMGDVILQSAKTGEVATIEIKAERKWTGNIFWETWSNLNLDDEQSFLTRGSNPGWSAKLRCRFILFHFLQKPHLIYVANFFELRKFLELPPSSGAKPMLDQYPAVCQQTHEQRNDTWGRIVKIDLLKAFNLLVEINLEDAA